MNIHVSSQYRVIGAQRLGHHKILARVVERPNCNIAQESINPMPVIVSLDDNRRLFTKLNTGINQNVMPVLNGLSLSLHESVYNPSSE